MWVKKFNLYKIKIKINKEIHIWKMIQLKILKINRKIKILMKQAMNWRKHTFQMFLNVVLHNLSKSIHKIENHN